MSMFSVILLIVCSIAVSMAGIAVEPNATHPDHPGKCYHSDSKAILVPGETKSIPGACMTMSCHEDFFLNYESCISYSISDPNCEKVEQDLSKSYPECCKKYRCKVDGKVTYV
ncbi:uncharacterized protein LOC129724443 [Wyeomyia smithii]|uniref:uncharacterized protein LOC129724443 n=1 Tax=Wyeomyia smithii TaxID=174621 RepID=UPI002467E186|nr:uncharacterized protein LOC129724443 [Wyeomyia smithii]